MSNIVEAEYPYQYTDNDGAKVSFKEGERFILISKSSEDWWRVQRTGLFTGKSVCYVPAAYVKEINVTPRGERPFGNQYINLDVYNKLMAQDWDGLSKLDNKTMVVPKQMSLEDSQKQITSEDYESNEELECLQYDEDGDDDEFERSLDDIPEDICRLRLDDMPEDICGLQLGDSSDASPVSLLSFEISPRNDRMKSFTLPASGKKKLDTTLTEFNGNHNKPKKPPRTNIKSTAPVEAPVVIPSGWTVIKDNQNETAYVNDKTQEIWKACFDQFGNNYFYNTNGDDTSWNLPEVESNGKPLPLRRKSFDETMQGMICRKTVGNRSPQVRNSKCQSVIIRSSSSLSSEDEKMRSPVSSRTASPHDANHNCTGSNQSLENIEIDTYMQNLSNPEKEGYLFRRKLFEGSKHVKKPVWQQLYCCKFGTNVVFYKDQKMACPKPGFPTGKPESSLDLHGAILDHVSKDKVKGKKNVFQITSYGGQNIQQFVADSQLVMGEWITAIQTTIKRLEEEAPLPIIATFEQTDNQVPSKIPLIPTGNTPPLVLSPVSPESAGAKPTMPSIPKKLLSAGEKEKGLKGFGRRFSKKVKIPLDDETKTKTKDKLKKYLARRPSFVELETKGIIKDYVFGCAIGKLCEHEDTLVPKIIVQIISEVERRGLEIDGIYRVSGNLSTIQKLRVMIDHGEEVDFRHPQWADIHILAGTLKLYFRELPEPLIPFNMYERFMNATKSPFKPEKLKIINKLIAEMPASNRETLALLITHLKRVMASSTKNRMHSQNLAIVFGPTLLWPEHESHNMAMTTVYQNQIIEFLILECDNFFPGL